MSQPNRQAELAEAYEEYKASAEWYAKEADRGEPILTFEEWLEEINN